MWRFTSCTPTGTPTKSAIAHAKEYKLIAPVVLDHDHKLTRLAEAEVTPEAAVFDAKGRGLSWAYR